MFYFETFLDVGLKVNECFGHYKNEIFTLDIIVQPLVSELVSISGCQTLNDMTSRARGREIELEHLGRRASDQVHIVEGLGKRTKASDQRLRGQQSRSQCNTCGKLHDGTYRSRGLGCYKCGMIDPVSRDCP